MFNKIGYYVINFTIGCVAFGVLVIGVIILYLGYRKLNRKVNEGEKWVKKEVE